MEHLTLPVLDANETTEVSKEVVEAEPIEDGCWRLLHSPAFVWGVARGDIVRLDPVRRSGFVVVERAGNLAIVLAVPSGEESSSRRVLEREIGALGGTCEGGPPRMLVFSIPVSAGFARVEAIFDRACARVPGASWWFGNVYGPKGEPLNWWAGPYEEPRST
jgi:hypothetical protein